jgi:hypothetical protein
MGGGGLAAGFGAIADGGIPVILLAGFAGAAGAAGFAAA